jgi:hypothetical protein
LAFGGISYAMGREFDVFMRDIGKYIIVALTS